MPKVLKGSLETHFTDRVTLGATIGAKVWDPLSNLHKITSQSD